MKRFMRLAVLTVGLLGLVATSAPPAQATTTADFAFTGLAFLGGPLGYPVTSTVTDPSLPLPGGNPNHCLQTQLPLPSDPATQCHTDPGGHTRGVVNVVTTTCQGAVASVNKPDKPLVPHVGPCTFSLAGGKAPEGNHVHGFCGLSAGQVQVVATDSLVLTYDLDIHFNAVGGELVLTGHYRKRSNGQRGLVTGLVTATPPLPPAPSCSTNAATTFDLVGTVTFVG